LPEDVSRQPRSYGVENASARIVLRARLDSWVQVFAADESLILTRVLQPGDSYRVPDQAGLSLVTGNAGGLEIEVDGTTLPPLGPVGAVRRGIALDAERLLTGTAMAQ
jgi:cytoskeleton protein RodZ